MDRVKYLTWSSSFKILKVFRRSLDSCIKIKFSLWFNEAITDKYILVGHRTRAQSFQESQCIAKSDLPDRVGFSLHFETDLLQIVRMLHHS